MIKRKDGSVSQRGLWDNIRANKGSGKKPTKQMLQQEKKIKMKKAQTGTQFGKYNIDTTGYSAGKQVFPYTAPNPRTTLSKKGTPATRTGKMGRTDLEKVMKWEGAKSPKKKLGGKILKKK